MMAHVGRERQRILVLGLHLIALSLLALHVYVRRFPSTATAIPEPGSPEALWWGLWPITYLPGPYFAIGSLAVVSLIAYSWWREFTTGLRTALGDHNANRRAGFYVLVAISGLLVIAFFAFPIVHTRWGDAYILANSIAWPDPDLRLTRSWQAPLDVFLHSGLWHALRPYVNWPDAAPVYRLLSPIAGAIYLGALLMLSRNQRFAPGWLTYGLVVTLGVIQLFFGYVENYSFAAATVLVYLWFGIAVAQRRLALWPAATSLALASALHPSAVVLGPSLFYLAWIDLREPRVEGNYRLGDVVIQLVAPMALVYGLTWVIMETGDHGLMSLFTDDKPGGGDARWLVPLRETTTYWERYTMFSWAHLRDFLNEQVLVAPVVLPSLLLVGVARLTERRGGAIPVEHPALPAYTAPDRATAWFLGIAFILYLAFTWLWNPDYGGQRDWDLFSLVALPETLLLVYALARTLAPWRYLAMGAVPLIALQALHTASWIYQNTLPWSWP